MSKSYEISCKINYLQILFYCSGLLGTGRQSLALPCRDPWVLLAVPLVGVCWEHQSCSSRAGEDVMAHPS